MSSTQKVEEIEVPDDSEGRLSDYAVGKFESLPSRKSVKKAIKRGLLLVDGKASETGHWVKAGEVLSVISDQTHRPVYQRSLSVLYEDDYIAAVQKPADLPVSGNSFRTLQNALTYNLATSEQADCMAIPRPVHRLDRLTGGVLLIAKTRSAAARLGGQFENRLIKKTYLAWVPGEIAEGLTLDKPIEGKEALTIVSRVKTIDHRYLGRLSLLKVVPHTGRRNQIRIHLSEAGYPILGDLKFGGPKSGKGLFLFAQDICFDHPESGETLQLGAVVPKKFRLS